MTDTKKNMTASSTPQSGQLTKTMTSASKNLYDLSAVANRMAAAARSSTKSMAAWDRISKQFQAIYGEKEDKDYDLGL